MELLEKQIQIEAESQQQNQQQLANDANAAGDEHDATAAETATAFQRLKKG